MDYEVLSIGESSRLREYDCLEYFPKTIRVIEEIDGSKIPYIKDNNICNIVINEKISTGYYKLGVKVLSDNKMCIYYFNRIATQDLNIIEFHINRSVNSLKKVYDMLLYYCKDNSIELS